MKDAAAPFSIKGESGRMGRKPFYSIRLAVDDAAMLERALGAVAKSADSGATLTATAENPDRLRMKREAMPEYERRTSGSYVRGDMVRVNGREGVSCNIVFTPRGAAALAECIRSARSRSRRFLELRVPSRAHDVVECVSDSELAEANSEEARLGRVGAQLAAESWAPEDFSDWEKPRG